MKNSLIAAAVGEQAQPKNQCIYSNILIKLQSYIQVPSAKMQPSYTADDVFIWKEIHEHYNKKH